MKMLCNSIWKNMNSNKFFDLGAAGALSLQVLLHLSTKGATGTTHRNRQNKL